MKRYIATALLVAGLSACGGSTTGVPTTEPAPPVTEAPNDLSQMTMSEKEDFIIAFLADSEYSWILSQNGKAWVLDLSVLICGAIDEGMTFEELVIMTVEAGADAEAIAYLTGAAVYVFCPENQWFVDTAGAA